MRKWQTLTNSPAILKRNIRRRSMKKCVLLKVSIWFNSTERESAVGWLTMPPLSFPSLHIKKRYCIHYYYNHTVIFTLKMVHFAPLFYSHTHHFLSIQIKKIYTQSTSEREYIKTLSAYLFSFNIRLNGFFLPHLMAIFSFSLPLFWNKFEKNVWP